MMETLGLGGRGKEGSRDANVKSTKQKKKKENFEFVGFMRRGKRFTTSISERDTIRLKAWRSRGIWVRNLSLVEVAEFL